MEGEEKTVELIPAIAPALRSTLHGHGIPDNAMASVLRIAQEDPDTTHPEGRLTKSRTYAQQCLAQVNARKVAKRNAGPRCEDHPEQPAAHCTSCISDVKCGDRHPDYIGRRQPAEQTA